MFQKLKTLFKFKKKPTPIKEILPGDNVRFYLKTPREFGIQSEVQYTFCRLLEEDILRGYIDGIIERIRIEGPIVIYEIACQKTKNSKNYIVLYSILDEEIRKISHLNTTEL